MPIHNADVAAIFEEIADRLEIQNANTFRIRAYRRAARNLGELPQDLRIMINSGSDLTKIPGIGDDLARKIAEIINTGDCSLLNRLRKELPAGITDLLSIPGLGPKRVKALYQNLDVQTIEQLYRAASDGRIRTLAGFGTKTEQNILKAIESHASKVHRFKLAIAAQYADSIVGYIKSHPSVKNVTVAGSFRRMRETVGDLDILATAYDAAPVMQHLTSYEDVSRVLSLGKTRASIVLKCGLQVDLRVVDKECYGAALHYFTGSKSHNIAIRQMAQKNGLKVSEYGVFRADNRIAGKTEESVYRAVGLPYIPPELREDRGEIAAAQSGCLPKLVTLADLTGDLHIHTNASDGQHSLLDMANTGKALGFEYIAITEHSHRLTVAHGIDTTRLLRQCDEIDQLNNTLTGISVLKGIEVDILEDGKLDLPDEVLGRLDLVLGAIHSHFNLSREEQTKRILRAMEHPYFTILAHPTGRLIEQRSPYDVDMALIIKQAKSRGCFLELNAHPDRLDLLDTYCQMAKGEGVLISINSDAHSSFDFANLRFGIGQARRGWLEKQDVLNTRPFTEVQTLLKNIRY